MVCVSYVPDLNGDGRLDAVATDPTFGTAYVVLQTGPRTFAGSPLLSSSAPQKPSIGDLNGDGRPDVAISWTDDADSPPDSPMNQNVVQHIDEVEELAVPFKDLWRSIILRAGWFECEGEPRPLVISIKFSADKLPLKKPAVLPAVGPFKVAWEAVGIDRFDQLLKSFREGVIEIEGKKLSLSLRENGKWTEFSSGFVNLERPGVYDWRGREFAEVRYSSTQSVRDDVYNPVRDRRLEELWRSLKTPYWDKNDVLREFFDVECGVFFL